MLLNTMLQMCMLVQLGWNVIASFPNLYCEWCQPWMYEVSSCVLSQGYYCHVHTGLPGLEYI